MKFTNYLKDIHNVSIYPLVSLVIFTAIFLGVIIITFTGDKKVMQDKANIPLN